MRYILYLTVVVILFPLGFARADEPAKGKVLLLLNERILEGDIDKVGGQYRIRRGAAETFIAVEQCQKLFTDWASIYQFQASRINRSEPEDRLKLASWCHRHQLREEALENAKAALALRPTHVETKNLIRVLERALNVATSPAPLKAEVVQASTPIEEPKRTGPKLDLHSEALIAFTTTVQPILMNTCLSCHTGGRGGVFQLSAVGEGVSRVGTQRNVEAVLAFTDLRNPQESMVLVKAISAHGPAPSPPLPGRQSIPFQKMAHWLEWAVATNPHLKRVLAPTASVVVVDPQVVPALATAPVFGGSKDKPRTNGFASDSTGPGPTAELATSLVPLAGKVDAKAKEPQKLKIIKLNDIRDLPKALAEAQGAGGNPQTPAVEARPTPETPRLNAADPYDPAVFNQGSRTK